MGRLRSRVAKLEGPGDHTPYGVKLYEGSILSDGTFLPALAITADNIFEQRPDEGREEFSARVLPLVQPHLTEDDMTGPHLDAAVAALQLRVDALSKDLELAGFRLNDPNRSA